MTELCRKRQSKRVGFAAVVVVVDVVGVDQCSNRGVFECVCGVAYFSCPVHGTVNHPPVEGRQGIRLADWYRTVPARMDVGCTEVE